MRSAIAAETVHTIEDPAVSHVIAPVSHTGMLKTHAEMWRQRLVSLTLILSDVVLAFLIWGVVWLVEIFWAPGYFSAISVASIVPITLVWVGLRATQGLYPGYGMSGPEELRRQTYTLLATLAFAAVFALTFEIGDAISRLLVGLILLSLLFFSPLMRHCVKGEMMRHGVWGKPVIIIGPDGPGTRLEELLMKEWALGYKPVAIFNDQPQEHLAEAKDGGEGMPRREALDQAVALTRNHGVDTLFLTMPHVPREYLANLAELAGVHFRSVIILPDLPNANSSMVVARDFAGTLGVEVRHNLLDPWIRMFKRGMDLIGALAGGLLISPLLVALIILIKLDSPGPVFFGHRRLGAGGTHFRCWKFRTMHPDAERLLEEYLKDNPHLQAEWEQNHKLRDDPRVTRVGRFLRKTSLDELPQLWNVLRAEMSLVGPRPIVDAEIAKYDEVYALYKRVKPGMSGFWQVSGRSDASYDNRVAMDAQYVRNWSLWLDLVILARTVRCVLTGQGAC